MKVTERVTVDEIDSDEHGEMLATLVTDDGRMIVVPLSSLPDGTNDGDVLDVSFTALPQETEKRREHIDSLQRRLFGDR
ncbi:MAG: DUF3006 domain-containing protein [Thermomicrobiales bacterium]|nr:DUF3006 domain-containing protein [Thermomicrobiales bacterium]